VSVALRIKDGNTGESSRSSRFPRGSFQLAHVSPTDGAELVATFAILGEIERAVWSMPGVTRIDNQLQVT
jgi:hypothetical protein